MCLSILAPLSSWKVPILGNSKPNQVNQVSFYSFDAMRLVQVHLTAC
jgi:hypothetical protein